MCTHRISRVQNDLVAIGQAERIYQAQHSSYGSLDDLVSAGYLREIPLDPITNSNQTWKTIMEDMLQSVDQTEPGIYEVQSGSDKSGLDGTPYADW